MQVLGEAVDAVVENALLLVHEFDEELELFIPSFLLFPFLAAEIPVCILKKTIRGGVLKKNFQFITWPFHARHIFPKKSFYPRNDGAGVTLYLPYEETDRP